MFTDKWKHYDATPAGPDLIPYADRIPGALGRKSRVSK